MRKGDEMRQKEVLQKLSQEMRDLHHIEVKDNMVYYLGKNSGATIGFPTSLIKSIEEGVWVDIRFDFGVLGLSKKNPTLHITLFDLKAIGRKIARERKKRR